MHGLVPPLRRAALASLPLIAGCQAILGIEDALPREADAAAPEAAPDADGDAPEGGGGAPGDAVSELPWGGTGGTSGKLCDGGGVPLDDPEYGCASKGCDPCQLEHATAECAAGACAIASCEAGWADCDAEHSNGCETTLGTDAHCAACDDACSSPNGQAACVDGICRMTSCPDGFADCNGKASDGCEQAGNCG